MKNLRFTFRMFKRNPLLVFVGLPGLAPGLAAVLLLMVYLRHELSFDQH
jgi:putative ABC transport system permease protein